MTAPTVSVQYEDLKAIASHFDHHAQEIIKVYRFIANQVHELRTEYWVGDNADIFYTSMDSDILPALSRLQQALAEGGDTTRDIIAIFQQAEEDGAAAFNGDDRVVSDDNRTRPVSRRLRQGVRQQASSDDMVGNNLEEDNRPPLCLDEPYGDCTNDITEANFQSVVNYLLSLMSMPNSIFTSDHVSDVDFDAQEIVARGLAQAIQNGDLDWPSVLQLLLQAQIGVFPHLPLFFML
jgi:WXG100 family type VII secretion target